MFELNLGDCVQYKDEHERLTKGTVVGIEKEHVYVRPQNEDYIHRIPQIRLVCKVLKNLVYNTKAIVEVTKEFTFDSSHKLLQYEGDCARLHGHTYKLQVTLKGTVNEIGMVLDFKDLKKIVKEGMLTMFDHHYLNSKMTFNTTAENMVVYIFDLLTLALKDEDVEVTSVKLWETPTSFAEFRGVSK